jgi:hypothetical protein
LDRTAFSRKSVKAEWESFTWQSRRFRCADEWQSKYKEAEIVMREVVDAQQRVLGGDHHESLWTKTSLARVLRLQNKLDLAEEVLDEILKHQQNIPLPILEYSLTELGMVRISQTRYKEAEEIGRKSLVIAPPPGVSGANYVVGLSLVRQGSYESAEPFLLDYYSWTGSMSAVPVSIWLSRSLVRNFMSVGSGPDRAAEWRAKLKH